MNATFPDLQTPCLLLDLDRMDANVARMQAHLNALNVPLRPHLKTPKSVPIAERLLKAGAQGFNVSTLNEAEYFFAHGLDDLFYCVPTSPKAACRAANLVGRGCNLTVMTDTFEGASAIIESLRSSQTSSDGPSRPLPIVIEIDVDGYRSGAPVSGTEIEKTAQCLNDAKETRFAGIMSYAGASYGLSPEGARELAERHCEALARIVQRLRKIGLPCAMVSLGSTPAILHAKALPGVSEARCGIYIFQDLLQAGIGACSEEDIALTILTTVTARHPQHNRLVIDAGGLALSKDRSTMGRSFDAAYGWVCDAQSCERIGDLQVQTVSQELGLVTSKSGKGLDFDRFPVGSQLRILPNHADMTAAAYDTYHTVTGGRLGHVWSRTNGWAAASHA